MTAAAIVSPRDQFDPLGAGALLVSVLVICVAAGFGIGHVAGDAGIGVAIGAVIGIPLSVAAVIVRYRGSV